MARIDEHRPTALRNRLRPAVVAVLSAAGLALGLLQAPPAAAADSCPPPTRAVLDTTPGTYANTVALTFDDGPSPQWTPQVLDILRARGVKATFFLVGSNVAAHPQIARRIVAEGHVIGNHTYTHPDLDRLSRTAQAGQMDRTDRVIGDVTGVRPCFFRGPYGSHHGTSVKDLAWDRGMNVAGWSRDTRDWETPLSPSSSFQDSIVQRATTPLTAHPTVLMHDGSPGTYRQNSVAAVDRIITFYASRGYVFTDPAGRAIGTSAIQRHYDELGGPAGVLGAPVTDELPTPNGNGAFRRFERGSIFWSAATGAHEVRNAIHERWAALGYERSALGFPTTDENLTAGTVGAYNHFERGSIYWSPATGAHEVGGAIHEAWSALGYELSGLGFPTSGEYVSEGVTRADFERGSITWTPETGAVVHQAG